MKTNKLFDQWLSGAIAESQGVRPPDHLWRNIARKIKQPPHRKIRWTRIAINLRSAPKWQFASAGLALVLALGLAIYSLKTPKLISGNRAEYLASEINEEVYVAQVNYEKALGKLEKQLHQSIKEPSNEWINLSLERIEMIDELIRECKISLRDNPYNPAIQKTLFTAYGKKYETIRELIHDQEEYQ
ncbi:MAG: hypothetical protein ACE5D1_04980 [Fidelibacterota bacterium]